MIIVESKRKKYLDAILADVENAKKPLSHASLIKVYVEGRL